MLSNLLSQYRKKIMTSKEDSRESEEPDYEEDEVDEEQEEETGGVQ